QRAPSREPRMLCASGWDRCVSQIDQALWCSARVWNRTVPRQRRGIPAVCIVGSPSTDQRPNAVHLHAIAHSHVTSTEVLSELRSSRATTLRPPIVAARYLARWTPTRCSRQPIRLRSLTRFESQEPFPSTLQ